MHVFSNPVTYNHVYVCCLVGHGKSSGEKVFIEDFQIYVRDVIGHIELLKSKYTNIPLFLLGHSMVCKMHHNINYLYQCMQKMMYVVMYVYCMSVCMHDVYMIHT